MTIKEITAIRKSGQLAEALQAAETEFSQNVNNYTAGALFWCLNDLYKKQEPNEASNTIKRMKSLYNNYFAGDEFMKKSIDSAEQYLSPHYYVIEDAQNKIKNGDDAISCYQTIAKLYADGELAPTLYLKFGWLIYYALKNTSLRDAYNRKVMLNNYLKLGLPKPSTLHSLILGEAVKVEKNTPLLFRIRDFIRLWGVENLREEDWLQSKTSDGNTLPSLVEKLIGVYVKELKTDQVEAPEEFSKLIDLALERYPVNQNMPHFKASVLLSQGKREEAIGYYRDLILRFPSKFYLWHETANLIDDIDTQLGLLSKALTLGNNEQFLGKVRLAIAQLLFDKGEVSHAKYELDKYRDLYQAQGWSLKGEYQALCHQLNNVTAATDNQAIYAQYIKKADDFIYSRLPEQIAIKVSEKQLNDRNRPGRKILLWTLKTQDGIIRLKKPAKFGLDIKSKNGVVYVIKTHEDKIVWLQPIDNIPILDWIKEVEGEIRLRTDRKGKQFAIIESTYIAEKLLTEITDGQSVRIRAVKQDDDRWLAISLTPLS